MKNLVGFALPYKPKQLFHPQKIFVSSLLSPPSIVWNKVGVSLFLADKSGGKILLWELSPNPNKKYSGSPVPSSQSITEPSLVAAISKNLLKKKNYHEL